MLITEEITPTTINLILNFSIHEIKEIILVSIYRAYISIMEEKLKTCKTVLQSKRLLTVNDFLVEFLKKRIQDKNSSSR